MRTNLSVLLLLFFRKVLPPACMAVSFALRFREKITNRLFCGSTKALPYRVWRYRLPCGLGGIIVERKSTNKKTPPAFKFFERGEREGRELFSKKVPLSPFYFLYLIRTSQARRRAFRGRSRRKYGSLPHCSARCPLYKYRLL